MWSRAVLFQLPRLVVMGRWLRLVEHFQANISVWMRLNVLRIDLGDVSVRGGEV